MKRPGRRGFTIVELLISLFIISFVLLAMSTMVISVMRANSQSKEMARATALLQDKAESLRNTAYGSLGSDSDVTSLPGVDYTRQWTVTAYPNYKTILITVSWNSNGPHSVNASTLRGQ